MGSALDRLPQVPGSAAVCLILRFSHTYAETSRRLLPPYGPVTAMAVRLWEILPQAVICFSAPRLRRPTVCSPTSTPFRFEAAMADDAHGAACGCFGRCSSYTPLATQETEPVAERVVTVRQGPELLALAFSDVSFTVVSTKPDGSGLSEARNSCFSY